MLHNLRFFFSSKCRVFHNATLFGSCIIHILNTGVLKLEKKFRRQMVLRMSATTQPLTARACTAWYLFSTGGKKCPPFSKSKDPLLCSFEVKTYPYYEPA
jgi:hypothetical protein